MKLSGIKQIHQAIYRAQGGMPHLEAIAGLPEIYEAEINNSYSREGHCPLKAVVFNIERGTRLEKILLYLKRHPDLQDADLIFANELDWGMARSNNRNVTEVIAEALGMNYAFGIEFVSAKAQAEGNREGLHGNAILSKFPLTNVRVLRLPIIYDWFYREDDSRLGTRVAILAQINVAGQELGLVCLHLENRATPQEREVQLCYVLTQADKIFGDLPILIGGDMNTNTVDGNAEDGMDVFRSNDAEQERRMADIEAFEPLMACAKEFGYTYNDCNLMNKSTRRKHVAAEPDILLNLDWFFQRGLICSKPLRVETVFSHEVLSGDAQELSHLDGEEMSDHDAIAVTCQPIVKA